MSNENKNPNEEVVYCRYKIVNGRKVFPKKAKAFRMVFRKKTT